MPYLVTCPNCSAKLKSGQPVAAGRALNCPQCKTAFTLSEPAPEIDGGTTATEAPKPPTAEVPKAPVPVLPPPPPAKSSHNVPSAQEERSPRKGRKAQEEEIPEAEIVDAADFDTRSKPKRGRDHDEDRPRSKRRDDDDDQPRSRSRDDEDDRPRSRRKDEDEDEGEDDRPRARHRDEEEDRPAKSKRRNDDDRPSPKRRAGELAFDDDDKLKARRSRNDDDYEDRPKARKSRDEDDDLDPEDDAPRSRTRSKKGKKGKRTLLIALLGGGAALLLVLFLVGFFLIDPFGLLGGNGVPSEMLAWAPADTESITVLDVVEARKLNDFKDGFAGIADAARHGLRADEISTMMVASRAGAGQDVVVYKLLASADQQKIIAAVGGKEVTLGGKKYYRTSTNGGLYFPSSRLVVVALSENTLQPLLQKSESSIIVSGELRSAAQRSSGIFVMASVGKAAESSDIIGLMSGQGGLFGPGPFGGKGAVRSATARSFVYALKVSGDYGTGTMTSTYDSSDTAKRIADDLRKNLDQNPTMRGEIDSFDVSQSGSAVTLTLRGPVKGKKTFMPFGGR